jgi:DNA-binding CsgD family transcriptional regulator
MNKTYVFIIIIFLHFNLSNAQNLSSQELISAWEISDVTQTLKAEEIYKDLKINLDENKLSEILIQLHAYLRENGDERLEIRIKMYEILSILEIKKKISSEECVELKDIINKAILIRDSQLLSELYSLYAEHVPGSHEQKLFYNTQAIEIQEKIGAKYFPKLYLRYFTVSSIYFSFEDYAGSLAKGLRCLELLQSPLKDPVIFCLQSDILGLNYFETGQIKKGFYHYENIKKVVNKIDIENPKFEQIKKEYRDSFSSIWKGVSDGGIAKGLILQKKFRESILLLNSNIGSSEKHQQVGDVAKAKSLLGEAYFQLGDLNSGLKNWHESYKLALANNSIKIQIKALKGIVKTYKKLEKYDSAYVYSEKYRLTRESFVNSINHSKIIEVNNRIAYQKAQNAIQEAEIKIKKQHFFINGIIIGVVLLIIIGFVLYNQYRLKQKTKYLQSEHKRVVAEIESDKIKNQYDVAEKQLKQFKEKLRQNNLIIETLKSKHNEAKPDTTELRASTILTKKDWDMFKNQFSKAHPNYIYNLREKYPELTPSEIRYLCLVKLNLRQDEIALALGVSTSSIRVTWHRMKKKLKMQTRTTPINFLKSFEKHI